MSASDAVVGLTLGGRLAQYSALEYSATRVSRDAGVSIMWFHSFDERGAVDISVGRLTRAGLNIRAVEALPANGTYCDLNKIRLLPSFWKRVRLEAPRAAHVLMFEADAATCGTNFEAFREALRYDYCGAPWPSNPDHPWAIYPGEDKRGSVGNAGFSLWRVDTAMRVTAARQREVEVREQLVRTGGHLQQLSQHLSLAASGRVRNPTGGHRFHALKRASESVASLRSMGLRFAALGEAERLLGQLSGRGVRFPALASYAHRLATTRAELLRALQAESAATSPCWETDIVFAHWCHGRDGFPVRGDRGRVSASQPSFEPPFGSAGCRVCPIEVASAFSVENMQLTNSTPFGFHKPWTHLRAWSVGRDDFDLADAPPAVVPRDGAHAAATRSPRAGGGSELRPAVHAYDESFSQAVAEDWAARASANPCLHVVREIRRRCGRACATVRSPTGQPAEVVRRLIYWHRAWAPRAAATPLQLREQATLPQGPSAALESWPASRYRLVVQGDANLVLYPLLDSGRYGGAAVWQSETYRRGECPCSMTLRHASLVLLDRNGTAYRTIAGERPLERFRTSRLLNASAENYFADLSDEGTLRLSHGRGDAPHALVWSLDLRKRKRDGGTTRAAGSPRVPPPPRAPPPLRQLVYWAQVWERALGQATSSAVERKRRRSQATLEQHPAALQSWPNAKLRLVVQPDANLVLFRKRTFRGQEVYDTPGWSSETATSPSRCPCKLLLRRHTLQLVDRAGSALYSIGKQPPASAVPPRLVGTVSAVSYYLDLRDDGTLRLSAQGGERVWQVNLVLRQKAKPLRSASGLEMHARAVLA